MLNILWFQLHTFFALDHYQLNIFGVLDCLGLFYKIHLANEKMINNWIANKK